MGWKNLELDLPHVKKSVIFLLTTVARNIKEWKET